LIPPPAFYGFFEEITMPYTMPDEISRLDRVLDDMLSDCDSINDLIDWDEDNLDEPREAREEGDGRHEGEKRTEDDAESIWRPPSCGGTWGFPGPTDRTSATSVNHINCFPANSFGPVRPIFLLALPKAPGPKSLQGLQEREAFEAQYFRLAFHAVARWARLAGNRFRECHLVIQTDAWPLPPARTLALSEVSSVTPAEVEQAIRRLCARAGLDAGDTHRTVRHAIHLFNAWKTTGSWEAVWSDPDWHFHWHRHHEFWELHRIGFSWPAFFARFMIHESSLHRAIGRIARQHRLHVHLRLFVPSMKSLYGEPTLKFPVPTRPWPSGL
jgi:hypothetical protein